MKSRINRRNLLIVAGVTFTALIAPMGAAQSSEMQGAVTFEDGKTIPKGQIEIYLEDPSIQEEAQRRRANTRVKSDGDAQTIAFSLALPASAAASSTLQVVALLERDDGWLLARGSAQVDAGLPVSITLNTALY